MISVIIPVYNQANKLKKCLKSLSKQTYKDFEIILVDDGSTDNIKEVVDEYKKLFLEKKFKFISKINEGSNPTRNRGFIESSGDYIIFCDADLILKKQALDNLLNVLKENPDKSFVYSSFRFGFKKFKLFPYSLERLRKMPYIHTSALIKREHFPGFDNKIKKFQDWDLWLTMSEQKHYGVWLNKVLFRAIGGGTISSWLPSFFYKIFPNSKNVKKYNEAFAIIKKKHGL